MDSISNITHNAFVNYFNSLRRFGNISKKDKYNLLVLWFFYYLKYKSDFLKTVEITKDDDGNITNVEWHIDRTLEAYVDKKFFKQLQCLSQSSCFIKIIGDLYCEPIPEVIWEQSHVPSESVTLLATNNTTLPGAVVFNDELDIMNQLIQYSWDADSNLMQSNDSDDDEFLTINKENYAGN